MVEEPQLPMGKRDTPSSSFQAILEKDKDLEAGHPDHHHHHDHDHADEHGHSHGEQHGHGHGHEGALVDSAITQIIGVAILEFGVLLHRFVAACQLIRFW